MNKLAIVCGSPSSEMKAPFHDADYDIWVLGNRLDRYPRASLVFEIHDDLSEHGDPLKYANWLTSKGLPLIVGEGFPVQADNVSVFPFDDAAQLMGKTYLTSSSAYMLALAILRGYEHVEIYGVDMAVDDHEYFWQRPCMEAWIGLAKGMGLTVILPPESPVFRSDYVEGRGCGGKPDFALPPFTQAAFAEMADDHQRRIDAIAAQIQALQQQITAHDGARQAYSRMAKVARAIESGQNITKLSDTVSIK